MDELKDDKPLWGIGEVLWIAAPASVSMLARTLMRFVDGYMVSKLNPEPFAAQLAAGMSSFVFESFIMGTMMAVNTYVAQNYGARRYAKCGEYARSGLMMGACLSVLALPLMLLARPIFILLRQDPSLVGYEEMYFRYMILTILPGQMSLGLGRFFYGVHRAWVVMLVTAASNAFNVLANWVLIYGHLGFPAMGLEGAAIGTLISICLELAMFLAVFLSPTMHGLFATRRWQASWQQAKQILRVGWPAGVQFSNDLLSWSLATTVLVGLFGPDHQAAHASVIRYISLSFMPAIGVGIAATSLVGRYIGEGRRDLARHRVHAAVLLAMGYMGLCGAAFFLFRHELVDWFVTVQPDAHTTVAEVLARERHIIDLGAAIMICAAVFQVFDAVGIVYLGALRGAGDTFWPMIATVALSWSLIVGGGLAMVHFYPELESVGPWIAASSYVIVLGIVLTLRFESGAWQKIDLLAEKPPPLPQ